MARKSRFTFDDASAPSTGGTWSSTDNGATSYTLTAGPQAASASLITTSPSPKVGTKALRVNTIASDPGVYNRDMAQISNTISSPFYLDTYVYFDGVSITLFTTTEDGSSFAPDAQVSISITANGELSVGTYEATYNWQQQVLSSSGLVSPGNWCRVALSYDGAGGSGLYQVKLFAGANLDTNTATYTSSQFGTVYGGGNTGFRIDAAVSAYGGNPVVLDDLIIQDDTWPTRSGGASTGGVKSGLSLAY